MFDMLEFIFGVGAGLVAYGIGIIQGKKVKRKKVNNPENWCLCGHAISYHENGEGHCKYEGIERCTCRKFYNEYHFPEIQY